MLKLESPRPAGERNTLVTTGCGVVAISSLTWLSMLLISRRVRLDHRAATVGSPDEAQTSPGDMFRCGCTAGRRGLQQRGLERLVGRVRVRVRRHDQGGPALRLDRGVH